MKQRTFRSILCSIFISAILASCTGIPVPGLETPTPVPPTPTPYQQALPPGLVETTPLQDTSIGQLSPITFYFSEPMNKPSVESAFRGLPEGTFTWNDEATVVFNPTQPYSANSELAVTIASSIKSSTGFGIQEPINLSFHVADYLTASNTLPKENAADVDVESAVAVSFNQPVVPLGVDNSSAPAGFNLQPAVKGKGEWINTSTYIFYPEPTMAGGTQYTIQLNPDLKTVTGVGLEPGDASEWKFTTALPKVVSVDPASDQKLALEPQIHLTFNQPMDTRSVEQSFVFSGPEGPVDGKFDWSENDSLLSFAPQKELVRNAGYILNIGAAAESKGGEALGEDYGAVFNTFDNFAVISTEVQPYVVFFTFSSPLPAGDYDEFVKVDPALDNFSTGLSEDGLSLGVYGFYEPETNYSIEIAAQLRDAWNQSLGDPFIFNFRTAPATPMLNVNVYNSGTAFVRPDDPALNAKAVNVLSADVTVAPITLQEYLLMQTAYENQQGFNPTNSMVYPHTFNLPPSKVQDVKLRLTQQGSTLLPNLYYVQVASPEVQSPGKNIYFAVSSQVNLTFKLGATEALVWAVDLPSQTPVANAPVTIYDSNGNQLISGTTDKNGLWKGAVEPQEGALYAVLGTPGSENFAMATSSWNLGITPWDFGYSYNREPPHTDIYMYTDRPMYRPGQTVYFRGVARQAFNGRYELPQINEVPLTLRDTNGTQLLSLNAQLSPYGTFNGAYELPEDAAPGYYTFENSDLNLWFTFQVAEYRKPEIDLTVDFSANEIKLGDQATADVSARYFFDAPVNDLEVKWALYSRPDSFSIPNYDAGMLNSSWLETFHTPSPGSGYFGTLVKEGTGRTNPEGLLSIELPDLPEEETGQLLTVEVTAQDESGLPVSARSEMPRPPGRFLHRRPSRSMDWPRQFSHWL